VLGLGRDGHVAFDEPGTLPEEDARLVNLAPVTIADAAERVRRRGAGAAAGDHRRAADAARGAGARPAGTRRQPRPKRCGALLEDPVSTRPAGARCCATIRA
jgi:hypothetical protein